MIEIDMINISRLDIMVQVLLCFTKKWSPARPFTSK